MGNKKHTHTHHISKFKIMPVCNDLKSQQRTASGVIIPLGGKVIVNARNAKTNCRTVNNFPDFWNKHTKCDYKKQHQITFENVKWMNLKQQPLKSCSVSYSEPTTLVGWYTNTNVTQLNYQTGLDIVLPAIRCAPKKYGHFHCTETRPGQMHCVCEQ